MNLKVNNKFRQNFKAEYQIGKHINLGRKNFPKNHFLNDDRGNSDTIHIMEN